MQLNQTYVPEVAAVQVDKPMEQLSNNQALFQKCPIFDIPWDTMTFRELESVAQIEQDAEQTVPSFLHSSPNLSSSLTTRKEKNRERERKRQTRLKEAFNVLRSAIPDHFSAREHGDRLSRVQTLKLAKKYIAALHELLQTS